jgi:predicted RNase H-like HicB family nuclease
MNTDQIRYKDTTLTAVFEELPAAEGGGYVAHVIELPGAISEGDTLDEARENLLDAISMVLETSRK